VLTLNTLLFIENGEPIQDGSVGVEDQQSHIRQCRHIQYVDQGFRRTGIELLASAMSKDSPRFSPGYRRSKACQSATPDAIAVRQGKGFEQQTSWFEVEIASPALQIAQCFFSEVCGTDLPGSTVVSRLEAQAMDHGLSIFQGVQIADMMPLVEHFAHHGVDHLAHQSGGLAAFIQLLRNGLAFADQGEIVIEQAGEQLQLIVGQMGL
jgi:hypothetical protein